MATLREQQQMPMGGRVPWLRYAAALFQAARSFTPPTSSSNTAARHFCRGRPERREPAQTFGHGNPPAARIDGAAIQGPAHAALESAARPADIDLKTHAIAGTTFHPVRTTGSRAHFGGTPWFY